MSPPADPLRNISIDQRSRRAVITMRGAVTYERWVAALKTLVRDGLWQYDTVYDLREVEATPYVDRMDDVVRVLSDVSLDYGFRGSVATIVRTNMASEDLIEKMLTHSDRVRFPRRVFTDMESAERWLVSGI